MNGSKALMLAAVVVGVTAGTASAAVLSAPSNTGDTLVYVAGPDYSGRPSLWIGADPNLNSGILEFTLPAITIGEKVQSANLSVTVLGDGVDWKGLNGKGLDLYGLRVNPSNAALSTDYFAGSYGADPNATALQQRFLYQPNEYNGGFDPAQLGVHSTGDSTALGAWIQSLYDGGATAGQVAFLRLNGDGTIPPYKYWSVGSAEAGVDHPILTLTTTAIPEPATMGLVGGALMLLLQHRRRA